MRNFHIIARQFAEWHPDMLHTEDGKNKRFFLVQSIAAMSDFTKTLPKNQSPCVAVDITPDMRMDGMKRGWRHTIYFLVKQEGRQVIDTDAAMDAVEAGYRLANTFMAWMQEHQEKQHRPFLGLMWDGSEAYPYGPLANGWYAVCLDVTDWHTVADELHNWVEKEI